MRAKTVNESTGSAQSVLLKQREKLMAQLEKAKEEDEKAEAKKEAFIEKYGEKAWDTNMDYYSDGYDSWKYAQMRYPGKAAWNGEGPIMRAINNAANKIWRIEDELKEIEEKLTGTYENEPEYEEDYIPGVTPFDKDKDYDYAMSHLGYKGPPGGPYTNYYNDAD